MALGWDQQQGELGLPRAPQGAVLSKGPYRWKQALVSIRS